MEEILSELDSIAGKVRSLESKREKLGKFLNNIKDIEIKDKEILEDRLSIPVKPSDLGDKKIAGIDGGLVKKSYHAIDMVLTKAVSAIFRYKDGKLENVTYVPGPLPTPKLSIYTAPLSKEDFSLIANLERMQGEVQLALKILDDKALDLTIMDGSIVPHPSSRPRKDSEAREKYDRMVKTYKTLFKRSDRECLLAGVSEDSRARRFSKIVSEKVLEQVKSSKKEELRGILEGTRDTNLLFHVLSKGERSLCFKYSADSSEPFGENYMKNLHSFYLQTTEYDRPIRVDFFSRRGPVGTADRLASLLLSVSSHNEEYGIPVPIIEADQRAKLTEEELSFVYSSLRDKVGTVSSLYKLRRDKRPF